MGRVTKLKLQYFGHITRGSAGQLALTVLEEIMEGLRHQGQPRRQWIHDIQGRRSHRSWAVMTPTFRGKGGRGDIICAKS